MVTPPARFTNELESHIAIAEMGADPVRAQFLIAYFVDQVRAGGDLDRRVLEYIGRAFAKALDVARGKDPVAVDPRQPLGLVRSVGRPKNAPPDLDREIGQFFDQLLQQGFIWDQARAQTADTFHRSDSTAERRLKEARSETDIELGRHIWECVRHDLAIEAEQDGALLARIEKRVFADFAATTGQNLSRMKKAYNDFLTACGLRGDRPKLGNSTNS
jgi:hypothetical protein